MLTIEAPDRHLFVSPRAEQSDVMRLELRLVVSVLLSVAVAQTPVPSRPTGYIYQSPSSPKIVVEAFYDLLCVDSKANWPVLKEVFRQFSDEDLEGIIHMFPLPYHHNAYFMQQASVVVRQTDPSQFIKMMELIFQQQDMFLTGAVNMTEPQVQKMIAESLSKNLPVDYNRVMEGFTDELVTREARYAWKYAASRAVTGTPQFLVNGVHVPSAPDYSVVEWSQFISSLLDTPY